jgi:hypothetical protein
MTSIVNNLQVLLVVRAGCDKRHDLLVHSPMRVLIWNFPLVNAKMVDVPEHVYQARDLKGDRQIGIFILPTEH